MNIETLAQLLEKTDFYRPLGQISEEMNLDYDQILEGLADMADRGIVLNLSYLRDKKSDMLLLSDDQYGKFMSIYSKSKRNKVKNMNEVPSVLSPRIQREAKMEEAVCSQSCQGMSLMEMEQEHGNPIFLENEREANRYSCRCLQVMALIVVLAWILNLLNIFIVPPLVMNTGMPICVFAFLLPTFRNRVDCIFGAGKFRLERPKLRTGKN